MVVGVACGQKPPPLPLLHMPLLQIVGGIYAM